MFAVYNDSTFVGGSTPTRACEGGGGQPTQLSKYGQQPYCLAAIIYILNRELNLSHVISKILVRKGPQLCISDAVLVFDLTSKAYDVERLM
jgi:hypothetical protein